MRCSICQRQLTAIDSISQGVGAECASKYATFIVGCGLSNEEVATMALSRNATVARWLSKTNAALRVGRAGDAKCFLERAAREYAEADYALEELVDAA